MIPWIIKLHNYIFYFSHPPPQEPFFSLLNDSVIKEVLSWTNI